jgi:cobalt-zinc-cadmium efflux system membrane fusion protein
MKCRELWPVLILVAFVSACGSKESEKADKASSQQAESVSRDETIRLNPEQARASGIEVVEVTEGEISPVMTVPGHVRTRSGGEAEVFSPFAGRLVGDVAIPQIGDVVAKGQRIADVEQQVPAADQFQAATTAVQVKVSLQQAQQDLDHAQQEVDIRQTELNRARQLYDGGAIALKQVQTAEFDLKQAQTRLQSAQRSVEQYAGVPPVPSASTSRVPIVAPIAGTVIAVGAALGQQVDPSRSVLKIADLTTVWVEAAVQEHDLGRARMARTAEISIPESGERSITGTLVTIGSTVDPQNRTVPIIYTVDNRSVALRIEMFVEARIPTGPATRSLLIPVSAVLSDQGAPAVYIETESGVFNRRNIQLGGRKGPLVVVTSGVIKGERVVSVGAQTLLSESRKGDIPVEEEEKNKVKGERD